MSSSTIFWYQIWKAMSLCFTQHSDLPSLFFSHHRWTAYLITCAISPPGGPDSRWHRSSAASCHLWLMNPVGLHLIFTMLIKTMTEYHIDMYLCNRKNKSSFYLILINQISLNIAKNYWICAKMAEKKKVLHKHNTGEWPGSYHVIVLVNCLT